MGNPEHIHTFAGGAVEINRWTQGHPGVALDCSGGNFPNLRLDDLNAPNINLSGAVLDHVYLNRADLTNANLSGARFRSGLITGRLTGANLTDADCSNTNFTATNLEAVVLDNTNLSGCVLCQTGLEGDQLRRAKLTGANLEHLLLVNVDLSGCDLSGARFNDCNLVGAKFTNATLIGATFNGADLTSASLAAANLDNAHFSNTNLAGACLIGASMRGAHLSRTDLAGSNLEGADLYEAIVDSASFDKATGLERAKNLLTVRLREVSGDVRYFEAALIPWLDRVIGWDRIRWLGRLPLFGASYTALIAIPFLYYLLDMFNRRVDAMRAWAEIEIDRSGPYSIGAKVILDHLHREPIPSLSLLLLISTVLLGAGATIFAIACPPRIREFNRDQWRDQLGHSLIHYLPLSWQHRWTRIICLLLYAIGGGGVLVVLASKLWNVFWFIIANRQ